MTIGILKEKKTEKRVALLPEAVAELIKGGHEVLVETGAGDAAWAFDADYQKVGAKSTPRSQTLEAPLLIGINAPENDEMSKLKEGQIFAGAINPLGEHALIKAAGDAKLSVFSLDIIPRTTRAQAMDVLSSMATVSGYKAVLSAATLLPRFFPMFMSAAGTIKPAKMLILGAGVAGLQAIATARKLGAVVEVFDVRSAVKEEVKSLGGKFIEVEGAREDAAAGGYAVEQTDDFKEKQRLLIHERASAADIIIGTAQIPGRKAPVLITRETVAAMRPGSLIIDLAASSGGNCELTRNGESYVSNGVTILGKSDFPSEMPTDASRMYGRNMLNFLKLMLQKDGTLKLDFNDDLIKGTCVTHNGEVVSERVKQFMV
ncbi:MAG: NAD(P)(+) transhydrogenase (Re/Si-specific) subunit alpha [Bacteroidetes bacterium HGW-Bacteroidetes-22]|nr:MAG: NAD(P)(+) transhydrogenase (Re/Si-specific) subunit alpha [Bacteroidetes bacterium HGW-Bacteroidetes-22]